MKPILPSYALLAGLLCGLAAPLAQAVTCQGGIDASNPDAAYTVNPDGTVTDTRSGLIWDRCAWGQTGNDCSGGGASTHTWADALAVATTANGSSWKGHADWRLPNIKELESLTEECRISPAINDSVFPNTPGWDFWSGSPYAGVSDVAWYVHFYSGVAGYDYRDHYGSALVRLVRGGQSFDAFDATGDITAPVLSGVGVSGTTQTATTLAATSDEVATGYWLVVARDAAAPGVEQVKAGASYGAVTVVGSGSGAMSASVARNFAVSGLTAGTDYDLYLVAQDGSANANFSTLIKVQFSTLANSHAITVTRNPTAGGTASCTPNPVNQGESSTCAAAANAGYSFVDWSGDCSGASCVLSNVTSAQAVTANFQVASASQAGIVTRATGVTATLAVTGCSTIASAVFVDAPTGAPANTAFPYGLLDFDLTGCGDTAEVTVTYSSPLPAGAVFYKANGGSYAVFPHTMPTASSVRFTLVDGGAGDSDGLVNNAISDPSGIGVAANDNGGGAQPIPTLTEWGMILLAGLMGLMAWSFLRRTGRRV